MCIGFPLIANYSDKPMKYKYAEKENHFPDGANGLVEVINDKDKEL